MKLATILAAALTLAACSTKGIAPMPNITQPPIQAQTASCNTQHDRVSWKTLKNDHRHFFIPAPDGYWATSAEVTNDMSNGVYVRGGHHGNKRTYVPGHDESNGGKPVYVKMGKHSNDLVLRSIADPSSGYVKIDVKFCEK
jgi:hypothetical protein